MKTIADVMSRDVTSVSPDDPIRRAAELMDDLDVGALPVTEGQRLVGMITDRDIQIRRVPVVSRDQHTLIGIVALADIAETEMDDSKTAQTLLEISSPVPVGQAPTTL